MRRGVASGEHIPNRIENLAAGSGSVIDVSESR